MQALRRSTGELQDATAQELSSYLSALSEAQLRGVASNVKGIYHELLFVQAENADLDEVSATLKEATNHPGGDVEFIVDGSVIGEVQLKAVVSAQSVRAHLERYPDINVLVTDEVASGLVGVGSSGFLNEELTRDVYERLGELKGEGLIDEMGDGLATSVLVRSAVLAGKVVRGQGVSEKQLRSYVTDAGIGVATAGVVDVVLTSVLG